MNLPNEKREALESAVLDATCASCGHEAGDHSWYGPCLVNVTSYDDACPCRKSRERVFADALAPLLAGWLAEARGEALRGVRFRVEVACDGYEALTADDVPDDMWSPGSYIAGAAEAAREIRAALG